MKNITIGIPKALVYYKYKDLWINFFENLNCNIIISPNSNKEILENGKKLLLDESCTSMKLYMGHVNYLIDKCDYILVPRIKSLKKHEKVCTNLSALYDLVSNIFSCKILNYNIDVEHHEDEEYAFITMGLNLGFTYKKAKQAYLFAKKYEKDKLIRRLSLQKVKLATSEKIKILVAGQSYNLYDNLVGKYITDYLEKENIEVIFSDCYDIKYLNNDIKDISKTNYFTYNKEIIGSIGRYKKFVDGILLLTAFPCGPDSLSNELIIRNIDIPLISIIVDELISDTGLITRLESFIDIIKERKNIHE